MNGAIYNRRIDHQYVTSIEVLQWYTDNSAMIEFCFEFFIITLSKFEFLGH